MVGSSNSFRALIGLAAVAAALALAPLHAQAALSVCNKTTHPATVALGFFDGKQWSSRGWWTIASGDCAKVVETPLIARYYYLYARHEDIGGAWEGDRSFCIVQGAFSTEGRADCSKRGYQAKKFFQVDTGNSADWTENLAD
jgi:uncharacterized membrane protein